MRTVKNLFSRLCEPEHLEQALAATARGKRRQSDVAWFLFRRDTELARLRAALQAERWRPEGVEVVLVRDPKPRLIARTPIADRVLHTALVLLMEPIFLRRLMGDAFACRPGYGTHRAVLRILEFVRRFRFAVHLDIKTYFPSVDLEILRRLLAESIRDERFLRVIDQILEVGADLYSRPSVRALAGLGDAWPLPGCGLPIGAYTSQLFAAHIYLDGLDHFIKRELKVPGYCRYVDDMFLFGNRRADLRAWRRAIGEWVGAERNLLLKHPNARILSCHGHLNALGYRITRAGFEALPRVLRRLQRRIKAELEACEGAPPRVDFERSVASTAGVVLF
jgi:hypothetical protein